MPIHSTPVRSVLALAGALFGVAPAAAPRQLIPRLGSPIPYRIGLPERAEIHVEPGLLSTEIGNLLVTAVAADMLEGGANPFPVSEAESRRILTSIVMGSDALLFALLREELRTRHLQLEGVVQEIGTLGGQRAACVRGRFEERGVEGWLDIHVTVRDGILYVLAFTVFGENPAAHECLCARIRDSFALPPGECCAGSEKA